MSERVYELIRDTVEQLGGSMTYERKGYRYGAWVIRIGERSVTFEGSGNQSFPELDRLYVPRIPNPRHWDDYLNELVPDAEAQLLSMLGMPSGDGPNCPRHTRSTLPQSSSSFELPFDQLDSR